MGEKGFVIDGVRFPAERAAPGLHVVATPIGNLADITIRALRVLAGVDAVAAEDTRHSGRLLAHYGITARMLRYDEHGAPVQRPKILAQLGEGASIALVSDAGTPLISDPGFRLVAEARAAGASIHAVPGPCAPIAALSVAGLPTDAFHFAGFLPAKSAARAARIAELAETPATLILFEAPHRLAATLTALADGLGTRRGIVARELTKRFETVDGDDLAALAERYSQGEVKGEVVILVAPSQGRRAASEDDVNALLAEALSRLPASAAAAEVARATGANRRALYRQALTLKGGG